MDILFTALGVVLVVAVWPALVLYAWNDSMLRHPRRRVVRDALARRRTRSAIGAVSSGVSGASTATAGVPARR